jgi:4-diphosphocytidyl-2-C-methyl-D-erythritol kinase
MSTRRRRTYRSFAKLNLHLQVVGRRADGYHELRTVFQSIDLHDLVTLELGGQGARLEVAEGPPELPRDARNLAVRAAAAFLERFAPGAGVRVGLRKRLPLGGGLGGGSSNAATVLLGLRDLLGVPARIGDLEPLARALGADVPYFLVGGSALGSGRGDEVAPLAELPETQLWLAISPFEVSTAEVFAGLGAVGPPRPADAVEAWVRGGAPPDLAEPGLWNDLEEPVRRRYPSLDQVYNALVAAGGRPVRMSGSGATFYARFPGSGAEAAAVKLPAGTRLLPARTLSRLASAARAVAD